MQVEFTTQNGRSSFLMKLPAGTLKSGQLYELVVRDGNNYVNKEGGLQSLPVVLGSNEVGTDDSELSVRLKNDLSSRLVPGRTYRVQIRTNGDPIPGCEGTFSLPEVFNAVTSSSWSRMSDFTRKPIDVTSVRKVEPYPEKVIIRSPERNADKTASQTGAKWGASFKTTSSYESKVVPRQEAAKKAEDQYYSDGTKPPQNERIVEKTVYRDKVVRSKWTFVKGALFGALVMFFYQFFMQTTTEPATSVVIPLGESAAKALDTLIEGIPATDVNRGNLLYIQRNLKEEENAARSKAAVADAAWRNKNLQLHIKNLAGYGRDFFNYSFRCWYIVKKSGESSQRIKEKAASQAATIQSSLKAYEAEIKEVAKTFSQQEVDASVGALQKAMAAQGNRESLKQLPTVALHIEAVKQHRTPDRTQILKDYVAEPLLNACENPAKRR